MTAAQYLYRRSSGIYFVRLCAHKRLKTAVGKGEIHRTTGCRDFRLAKIVACELAKQWHEELKKLEAMDVASCGRGRWSCWGRGSSAYRGLLKSSGRPKGRFSRN